MGTFVCRAIPEKRVRRKLPFYAVGRLGCTALRLRKNYNVGTNVKSVYDELDKLLK